MSSIKVHSDEFADVVMIYLFDMIKEEESVPDNGKFKEFLEYLESRGLKSILYKEYLSMNTDTRIKYKRIKNALQEEGGTARILITKGDTSYIKEEEEQEQEKYFDRELCKQIFRKVKDVRFRTSMPITEERLDKIIDYCVKKKEEQKDG